MSLKTKPLSSREVGHISELLAKQGRTLQAFCHAVVEREFQESLRLAASAGKHPAKKSAEYVTRMLKGQRAVSPRWRVWIDAELDHPPESSAAVLGDRTTSGQPAETTAPPSIHPADFWPHMEWFTPATGTRRVAAKLYGLTKGGLEVTFDSRPGHWNPPAGFSGYSQLKNHLWEEFTHNFTRMHKEPPNPEALWHVAAVRKEAPAKLFLLLRPMDYRDVLVTSSLQGLGTNITLDNGAKATVEEWLTRAWKPGDPGQPVIPCARQLVVNLMVLTREGEAVLAQQGPDNPASSGAFTTSVSTLVLPLMDSGNRRLPSLDKAAARGLHRELGLTGREGAVQWLCLAAGLKLGSFTFFGVVQTQLGRSEIEAAFQRTRSEYVSRRLAHEVVGLDFLPLNSEAVAARLAILNYRPYMELGLALALWSRGEASVRPAP